MFEQCSASVEEREGDGDARSASRAEAAKALCGCVQHKVHSQCFSLGQFFRLPHAPPRRVPPHVGLHPELNLLRPKQHTLLAQP